MMPGDLHFGAFWWLWGLMGVPVLACLFFWAEKRSARRLAALLPVPRLRAQLTGTASVARRRWRYAFLLLGLAGLLVTLAQPRWGYETRETHRRGLDVIAVFDVSRSMLATDVAPNRLTRAKLVLHDLVLELNGDRLGLVAFAGNAFLQAPLTTDYDAVLRAVDELDTNLIPVGGTNIGAGLDLALEAFGKAEAGNRAILLLSDGEPTADSDQANGEQAASRAAEDGVKVFTLGFGTPEGSLIPLENAAAGEFVRDAAGQVVRTRLGEDGLKAIALAGGGFYVHFSNGRSALQSVVQDGLSRLKTAEIDARSTRRPIERYQWPLGLALLSLSVGIALGERRKSRAPAAEKTAGAGPATGPRRQRATAMSVWLAAALCLGCGSQCSVGRGADAQGQPSADALELYRGGHYDQAYSAFEDLAKRHPEMGNLQFDAGASAYMAQQYGQALDAFAKALTSDDPALQAKSHYNFGNTLFRRGEQQQDRAQKMSDWRDAIEHFNTVLNTLKTQPPQGNDALATNTRFNRDLVQRRLDEELKQPPPKQPSPKKDPPSQPDQQKQPKLSGSEQEAPTPGGKQGSQDEPPPSSTGSDAQSRKRGQQGQQNQGPSSPADQSASSGQEGQRPDPASVPNQDKPRQRGDFKAGQDETAKEPASEQGPQPEQGAAAGDGKMTPEQARSLLQSLKDEDATVNLNDDPDGKRRDEPVRKDW